MRKPGGSRHLIIASVANSFNGFTLFNIAPVLPVVRDIFNVSIFEAGLLVTIPMLGVAAAMLPGGILSDRLCVKKALILALLSALPTLLLIAFMTDFTIVLILRFILGLSCGLNFAGTANYTSVWSEEKKLARNQGIFGGAFGFGIAAAYVLSIMTLSFGWTGLSLTPLPILLVSILIMTVWGGEHVVGRSRFSMGEVGRVVANRGIILLGLSQFVLAGLFVVVATWITSYLVAREQALVESIILGAIVMSMVGFSRMAGGYAARFIKERSLVSLSLFICLIALVALTFTPVIPLAFTLAILIIWMSQAPFGPVNRLTVAIAGHLSGTGLGMVLFITVLGTAVLPTAYGYVLDYTLSYESSFWFLAIIAAFALTVFYTIFRVRPS